MMLFLNMAIAASMAVGGYALIGMVIRKLYVNGATATLLLVPAFGATAGGEFVREGSRKPYSIRQVLYSNSITPEEVARLREVGCVANDRYPLRGAAAMPNDQVRLGAKVYRRQCSVCHTVQGANGVADLTASWDHEQMRMNIAKLQHTKPFMPPFAGTAAELEALVQFLSWSSAERPATWIETTDDAPVLREIDRWLTEAGTLPGNLKLLHK
jgi:mono/diheme cytochrome c family protein